MSNMTSSTSNSNHRTRQQRPIATASRVDNVQQEQQQHALKRPDKRLTDFSIESIMKRASQLPPSTRDDQQQIEPEKQQHLMPVSVAPEKQQQQDRSDESLPSPSKSGVLMMMTMMMDQIGSPDIGDSRLLQDNRGQEETIKQGIKKYRPKNFQCPVCEMAFSNNGQLKNHVRIHTGERPFRCNHSNCNKTFTRNEELTRHKLIHTGVRPHICTCCGKGFGRKDHLKKHVRTHERKKFKRREYGSRKRFPGYLGVHSQQKVLEYGPSKQILGIDPRQKDVSQMSQPSNVQVVSTPRSCDVPTSYVDPTNSLRMVSSQFQTQTSPAIQDSMAAMDCSHRLTSTTMIDSFSPTTANALQHIASDCWRRWYNLFGFQQRNQQVYHSANFYNNF